MPDHEELRPIVEGLIEVLRAQAKTLERFAEQTESLTGHLGYATEFGVTAAELSELLHRVRSLDTAGPV